MYFLRYYIIAFAVTRPVLAVDCVVDLPYASYRGTRLLNGVTQWLGIRYAAPPVGELRFAAPRDPPSENNGTRLADAHGPYCLGTQQGPPSNVSSEDCLFLDVYAPTHATPQSGLPVYFFIQGGGFNTNSNPNYNGSGLILAGDMDLIVVTMNYRVSLYGFLASEEVLENGSTNNGLRDQRKAMEWVQKYIGLFGGSTAHVTMGGDSAGAQSVDLQVTAYGGRDDHLFHATTAESQSFSQLSTVKESQYTYDNLIIRANCSSVLDTLSCLRNLTAAEVQTINFNIPFPGATQPPLYMYGPTLDFDFITDYTYRAYAQGKFVRVPAIAGDVTNEGTVFTPNATATIMDSNTFIRNQFPAISLSQLAKVNSLYPVENTPSFPDSGRFWRQVSDVYGEMRYICPTIAISDVYATAGIAQNWNYHWNVIDPVANASGFGVTHTVELNAIWGPDNTDGSAPTSYYPGGVNAAIVPAMQAYWTSFIRTYDPNAHRLPGTPRWEAWEPGTAQSASRGRVQVSRGQRLRFQTNATAMEEIPAEQRERCEFWKGIGVGLRQ